MPTRLTTREASSVTRDPWLEVTNRHYFRDLSAYACTLTHLVNGEVVEERTLELAAKPRETVVVPVEATGSWRIAFRQKEDEGLWPKGWTIADDQVDFSAPRTASVRSGKLAFEFSEKTGELVSLKSGRLFKTELLKAPLTLDVFRAPVQNEWEEALVWKAAQLERPVAKPVSFARRTDGAAEIVTSTVDYFCASGRILRAETTWRIADGAAEMKTRFSGVRKDLQLARVGWRTVLDSTSPDVEWLGCGPFENYADRRSGAFLGLWRMPAADFFVPYDVPQDCGNREGTYRLTLSTLLDGLTVETLGKPFAFEVCPYTPEELMAERHPAELPPSKGTFVGVYAQVRGLGGHSCGPYPLERDMLQAADYELNLVIK